MAGSHAEIVLSSGSASEQEAAVPDSAFHQPTCPSLLQHLRSGRFSPADAETTSRGQGIIDHLIQLAKCVSFPSGSPLPLPPSAAPVSCTILTGKRTASRLTVSLLALRSSHSLTHSLTIGHQEAAGAVGTPKLGGPLQLTDQHGNPFDSTKLKDKFLLVYFGFTHCPDVCPEELDRMGVIMNIIGMLLCIRGLRCSCA